MKPAEYAIGETAAGRHRSAELIFARGGGRSALVRQITPYPFHITKPFFLDGARPDLATLYLQSASGGIYRADQLDMSLTVKAGAAAHVTSQAATVVHDTGASPARQTTTVTVGENAFAALTLDPLVMFPGAEFSSFINVQITEGSAAIIADGVTWHDYTRENRPFGSLTSETIVMDHHGRRLICDRSTINGSELVGTSSLLGPERRAYGSALLLADRPRLPRPDAVESVLSAVGCFAGVSRLPNDAGLGVRIVAANGARLSLGAEALFAIGVEAMMGFIPTRRRK